jgi:hypothetical protein
MLYDIIEALREQGMTAYRLSKLSRGGISMSNAHRLMSCEADDVRLSTAVTMAEIAGLELVLREREEQSDDDE